MSTQTPSASKVQLVIFLERSEELRSDQLFEACFGEVPDTTQRNRQPSSASPFLSTSFGQLVKDVTVHLQVYPGRIDVLAMPNEEVPQAMPPLFEVEPIAEILLSKIEAVMGALEGRRAFRLGYVTDKILINEDEEACNRTTGKWADYDHDISGVHDPVFQINVRSEPVPKAILNRLAKISTQSFRFVSMPMPMPMPVGQGFSFGGNMLSQGLTYGSVAEIDVNTAPELVYDFSANEAVEIFYAMHREAMQMLKAESVFSYLLGGTYEK